MEIIIKGIIFGIILWLIEHSAHKNTIKGKLFFGRWMLWFGLVSISFPLIIYCATVSIQGAQETIEILPMVILILFFGGFGIFTIFEYMWTGGDYGNEHLAYKTPLKGRREINFSEIDYISYNEEMRWYLIYFKNQKIRLSRYLSGADLLIEALLEYGIPFKRDTIENRLFLPRGRLYMGIASLLFSFIFVYMFFPARTIEDTDQLISFLLIVLISGTGGMYAILSYMRVSGHYTDNDLTYQPLFGKAHKLPFEAIDKVSYNNYLDWLIIHTSDRKLRLSDSLHGLDFLLQKLDKHGLKIEN